MLKVASLAILICLFSVGAKAQNQCSGYLKSNSNPFNLDVNKRTRSLLTAEEIRTALLLLEKRIELNYTNVIKQPKSEMVHAGLLMAGQSFALHAKRVFGSWDKALEAAGIKPTLTRKRVEQKLSETQMLELLKKLYEDYRMSTVVLEKMDKTELATKLGQDFGMTGMAFKLMVSRHFGTWAKAVSAAKINTEKLEQQKLEADKAQVLKVIQALESKGKANYYEVANMPREELAKIHGLKDFDMSGGSFVGKVRNQFGSWDKALLEAGLNPKIIRRKVEEKLSETQVLEVIKAFPNESNLNYMSVRNLSKEEMSAIHKSQEFNVAGAAFIKRAEEIYGSWNKALEAAGYNSNLIRKRVSEVLSENQVLETLMLLTKEGKINYSHIERMSREELSAIHKSPEFNVSGSAFIVHAIEIFGSWDKALLATGLDPNGVRLRFSMDHISEKQITEVLQALDALGLANRLAVVSMDRLTFFSVHKNSELNISGRAFEHRVDTLFGSWDKALLASGLDPNKVRLNFPMNHISKQQIIEVFKILGALGIANRNSVKYLDRPTFLSTHKNSEINISGRAFENRVDTLFDSWDKALIESGLNPDKVRRQGWASYTILTEAMKAERRKMMADAEGMFGGAAARQYDKSIEGVVRIATEVHNPETIALRRELDNQIEGALSHLSSREQQIFTTLIKSLEEMQQREDYYRFDLSELILETTRATDVREREVQDLFMKMSANQELKELLLEVME